MRRQISIVLATGLLTAGCAHQAGPGPVEDPEIGVQPVKPIESFERVGDPQVDDRGFTHDNNNLSTDVQRLQAAQRDYQAAKAHRAAEARRRQRECRESGGHEVPIASTAADDDGSDNGKPAATYCEKPTGDADTGEKKP